MSETWREHHQKTKNNPPSALLLKAFPFIHQKETALDLGCGGLKDTRFLLEQGLKVTAVDHEESVIESAKDLDQKNLNIIISSFENFDFPQAHFDLVSSMFSLPFINPGKFSRVFEKIKTSLKPKGILTCQLFGLKDQWKDNPNMTFHSFDQVKKLLSDFKIIMRKELEYNGTLTNGQPKHWHIFNIIAEKI